jgi:hypothetical protein
MKMARACFVLIVVGSLGAFIRPSVFAAHTAQTSDTPTATVETPTATSQPTFSPTATATPSPTTTATGTETPSPTITPIETPVPTATATRTPTRTATPSPPVVEPNIALTAFYARSLRVVSNSVKVGLVTLSMTVRATRPATSPIQLGWSISNGQSILAHHQIHTQGWTGERTFTWNYVFKSPGSYIGIGVTRYAGKTQVRALALDVRK